MDLELLADKQVRQAMQARYQFGEYYRQFVTISDWLLANGEISLSPPVEESRSSSSSTMEYGKYH